MGGLRARSEGDGGGTAGGGSMKGVLAMAKMRPGPMRLPLHLKWSGPREYDLADLAQRARVYEIVLREGRAGDLRDYIDPDELRRLWTSFFLPAYVRAAWEDYFSLPSCREPTGFLAHDKGDAFYTALSPFQLRLARLFLNLPGTVHFALAGGAALIFRRAVPRTTVDLDFFGTLLEEVVPAAESFVASLDGEGLRAEVVSSSPFFVRLSVHGAEGEEVLVDIGRDSRLWEPEWTEIGRILRVEELAAGKLLALSGRAEPRDFVDVFYLARRFGIRRMLEWAAKKDVGFDPYRLALGIGRLESLPHGEFEVGNEVFAAMAGFFRPLRAELIAQVMDAGG